VLKELKTISLKIHPDQTSYLNMLEQGRELFNAYTNWIYENGTYNKNTIHKNCYQLFLEKYPLVKVALQQTVRDVASEACKRNKIRGKTPLKKSLTIRLNRLCFTLRGKQLTLITSDKRHKEILRIPDYYRNIYENWKSKGADLTYDKKKKQFWIHIVFENPKEIKQISSAKAERTLGIDRGIYNPVVTSDISLVGKSKEIRMIKSKYQYLRQQLQKKGTRSAKRRLRQIGSKEKRFVLNTNHVISKKLADSKYDVFVLEELKKIKSKKYSHKFNRKLMNWSYFQFEQLLDYKANARGKIVVKVNPAYTSQTCSCCGKVAKEQRNRNWYTCSCGHHQHADLNAAINIKNKYLNSLLVLKSEGAAVNQPIESEMPSTDGYKTLDSSSLVSS
jgi:IS605 OrfB family transposase